MKAKLSRIGLGCSGVVHNGDGKEGIDTIRAALDSGITFLNTADFYGSGISEMLIGEAIKGYDRDKILFP